MAVIDVGIRWGIGAEEEYVSIRPATFGIAVMIMCTSLCVFVALKSWIRSRFAEDYLCGRGVER